MTVTMMMTAVMTATVVATMMVETTTMAAMADEGNHDQTIAWR